ncbi:MAG: dimethylarginine dimethylaminohydrolase family protein [Pyrinomonadaceae bacterium]
MSSRAIVRPPGANYADGLTRFDLGVADYALALRQHALYCQTLEMCGLKLTRLEADKRYPDSTFIEDTAVIVRALPEVLASAPDAVAPVAILTRPGAASRLGEVQSTKVILSKFSFQMHSIQEPGTLDGGDICEAGNHFFIGISERTNEAGAQQLADLLTFYGYTSCFVDIRAAKNILHLKSGMAYLGDNRMVVIDAVTNRSEFQGYELVRVSTEEEYAANCVRVNANVLIAAGYPGFARTLANLGYKTIALEMSEFQKMDGGLSCLSLRS